MANITRSDGIITDNLNIGNSGIIPISTPSDEFGISPNGGSDTRTNISLGREGRGGFISGEVVGGDTNFDKYGNPTDHDGNPIITPTGDDQATRKNTDGSDPNIWTPDTNSSPEDNLNSLSEFLLNLFSTNSFSTSGIVSPSLYASVLTSAYRAVQNLLNHGGFDGFDREALLALAEKASDISYAYISKQFESALAYQSWYLQQEYNSPLNQLNRLTEAGLSSAFVTGGYNSGNASNAAQVGGAISMPGASGAGQIQQQKSMADQQQMLGLLNMGVSAAGALGGVFSAAAGAVNQLVQAKATKALTPIQIAQGRQDLINSAATFELLQNQSDEIKQNMALNVLNSSFDNSNKLITQAREHVDTSRMRYDTAFQNYSQEYEELEYEVNVVTKDGRHETRRVDRNDVRQLLRNRGKFSDGSTVVGVSSWEKMSEAELNASAKLGIPGGGSVGVGGSGKHRDTSSGSSSNTSSSSKETENVSEGQTSSGTEGYSSDGNSFSIGDTKFTSVTTRKRLPLPEFADRIASLYKDWQDSFDRYNTLSVGERSKLLQLLNNLTRNLSRLSQGTVHSVFDSKLKALFDPKPNSIVAD